MTMDPVPSSIGTDPHEENHRVSRALPNRANGSTLSESSMRIRARRSVRGAAWLGAVLLLAMPTPAISQIATPVAVGTPLRITPIGGSLQRAWFESQSAEGLQIRVPCDSGCERLTTRAWSSLRQVDALVRGPGSVKHAVIGGLLGGAATYVVMFAVASKSQCSWDAGSCPAVGAAELTPGLVSVGTLLGASLGWTTSRDRWETVWTFDAPEPR
jgi:hypothetical protein